MKTLIAALSAFVLFGCSGEAFTGFTPGDPSSADADSTIPTDGGPDVIPTSATGGSGGLLEEDGGPSGSGGAGGAASTGGSTSSAGGALGTGGTVGCALVTHDNGLGQTWQDCVPLGTYNLSQAMKACAASGAVQCFARAACGLQLDTVRGYDGGQGWPTGEWGYGYNAAGYVAPGNGDGNLRGSTCGGSVPGTKTWN